MPNFFKSKKSNDPASPQIGKKNKKGINIDVLPQGTDTSSPTDQFITTAHPTELSNPLSSSGKLELEKKNMSSIEENLGQFHKKQELARAETKKLIEHGKSFDRTSSEEKNKPEEDVSALKSHIKNLSEQILSNQDMLDETGKALGKLKEEYKHQVDVTGEERKNHAKLYQQQQAEVAQHVRDKKDLQSQHEALNSKYEKQSILVPKLQQEKENLAKQNTENIANVQKRDQVLLTNKKALATTDTSTTVALAASVGSAVLGGLVQIPFIKSFIQRFPIINTMLSLLGIGGLAGAATVGGVKAATYSKNKEAKQAYNSLQTDIAEQSQKQEASLAA